MAELNGVLLVDKPVGPTSHDVVGACRRALRTRQVGHTGTLDPFASGLLLVCVGPATRLAEYLAALPKTYRATMRLGAGTDTDDHTGQVLTTSDDWRHLSADAVRDALASQVGVVQQLPPIFSAKKVDGQRMYDIARRGGAVERRPVTVTITRIDLLSVALPYVEFEVDCGSGTYIRAIARDAGETLGVGGHLTALRRTRVGVHDVARAAPLDALADEGRVHDAMLSPGEAVAHLPSLPVDADGMRALGFGRPVPAAEDVPEGTPVALVSAATGALLAIGARAGDVVKPRKVFA